MEKIRVQRAQIKKGKKYPGQVDTTARGCPIRSLAPKWSMVKDYKNGKISAIDYTKLYDEILNKAPQEDYEKILTYAENSVLTLLCFCRDDWFCHTYLLMQKLKEKFPDKVK